MKILSIGIGFISAALFCGQASAGETYYEAGSKAAPMQQAGGTARAMAMGSAAVALDQGSASLLWNPAALSRINCTEIGLHHNTGLGGITQETVILGMPLGEAKKKCNKYGCSGGTLGGIAASFSYADYGSFSGRDTTGLLTGDYQARDFAGSLGWGKELFPYFSGGVALKSSQTQVPSKIYQTYTADIGFLWNVVPALDLGLTYSNLNLGSKVGGSQLASGWRLGAGWTVDKHLMLAVSGELQNKAMNRLQVGGEYLIGNTDGKRNIMALRAGYQLSYPDPQLSGLNGLTLGLGYAFSRSMTLDYAMLPTGDLGSSHRLSLTFKFDCLKKAPVVRLVILKPAPKLLITSTPVTATAPAPKPIVLKEVYLEDSFFDFDSSDLRPEGMEALRENVQLLKENPNTMVDVAGYTSMRGTEEYNQKLSERRALAVSAYLISEGIEPGRITAIGYGETRPAEVEASGKAVDKNSPAAQANKRVVSTVTEIPKGVEVDNSTFRAIKE